MLITEVVLSNLYPYFDSEFKYFNNRLNTVMKMVEQSLNVMYQISTSEDWHLYIRNQWDSSTCDQKWFGDRVCPWLMLMQSSESFFGTEVSFLLYMSIAVSCGYVLRSMRFCGLYHFIFSIYRVGIPFWFQTIIWNFVRHTVSMCLTFPAIGVTW